jgi:hypothetical protein
MISSNPGTDLPFIRLLFRGTESSEDEDPSSRLELVSECSSSSWLFIPRLRERLFPRRPLGSTDYRGRFEWDNISCFGYPSWIALKTGIPELGTVLSDSIAATRALRGENSMSRKRVNSASIREIL